MLKKLMTCTTLALLLATGLAAYLSCGPAPFLPLAIPIALATTTYHLAMRLLVGLIFDNVMHDSANIEAAWFAQRPWEPALYKRLRVRRWKRYLPTYNPASFDIRQRTWDQIAQAMCQAELVHEVIIVLSFAPLVVCLAAGDTADSAVFAITSTGAACIDFAFVVMQRYNRPRVLKLAKRRDRTAT